jgi:hypothetical protein
MIDLGCIHNGLPRRVQAWFDVAPEENPAKRDRACLSKSRRLSIPATGGWGRSAPSKSDNADFRADSATIVYKRRGVTAPEELYAWQ